MGKNVAVFVDVANIFYAAKAAGVDIDYVTLLKSATAGRDFVRAYAYTGLDPDNENQRNFHQFLDRHSYKVVSKDIRKYGDGKVKANLDIELVVDMMKTARNLDVAVIVSGDGDFAPAIRAVQEMGVRVEVISFRGNTSSDLIEAADLFTDITHIAKVDKSSTRSGRRVADDDEDLSMTEVPDKMTEGTGRGRGGRGRGGRGRDRDEGALRGRTRDRDRDPHREEVVTTAAGGQLVALPGEKLSRAGAVAASPDADEPEETSGDAADEVQGDADARRRRRRRGGRGRGRGRRDELGVEGVDGELPEGTDAAIEAEPAEDGEVVEAPAAAAEPEEAAERPAARGGRGKSAGRTPSGELPTPFDDLDALASTPRAPRSTPFGSVWDRQLGTPVTARPAADLPPLDEVDIDEPEIPEYLLTERAWTGWPRRPGWPRWPWRWSRRLSRRLCGGHRARALRWSSRHQPEPLRGAATRRSGWPQRAAAVAEGSCRPAVAAPTASSAHRVVRAARSGARSRRSSRSSSGPRCNARDPRRSHRGRQPSSPPATRHRPRPRRGAGPRHGPQRRPRLRRRLRPRLRPRPPSAGRLAGPPHQRHLQRPVAEAPAEAPKRRTTRRTATPATPAEPIAASSDAEVEATAPAPKRRTTRKASTPTEAPAETTAEPAAEAAAPKRRTTRRKVADAEG